MVKITFAKGAKTIEVLEDVYDKKKAQAIAEKSKGMAFGIISGIMKAFDKSKKQYVLSGYQKLYLGFWHIIGESVQEYKRTTHYGISVKPEVRSITLNRKTIKVDPQETWCHFDAEDHCFEHYSKETIQSAMQDKERNLDRYIDSKRKTVRNLGTVQNKQTVVAPIVIRASWLVNKIIKELIKPIQADKIIQEVVEIKRLVLVLRPFHVFEFREEGTENAKTIEINAITGSWKKGDRLLTPEFKKRMFHEGVFEVGAELASSVIPGAAFAATLGKHLKSHQDHAREVKQAKAWGKAYEQKRKKKK